MAQSKRGGKPEGMPGGPGGTAKGAPPKSAKGIKAWVKAHPGGAAAIGGAGLVGAYVLVKKSSAAGQQAQDQAAASGPGHGGTVPTVYTGWPGGGPGGGNNNATLIAELRAIENQLARITAGRNRGPHKRPPIRHLGRPGQPRPAPFNRHRKRRPPAPTPRVRWPKPRHGKVPV